MTGGAAIPARFSTVERLAQVDSTNAYLAELARRDVAAAMTTVVVAGGGGAGRHLRTRPCWYRSSSK